MTTAQPQAKKQSVSCHICGHACNLITNPDEGLYKYICQWCEWGTQWHPDEVTARLEMSGFGTIDADTIRSATAEFGEMPPIEQVRLVVAMLIAEAVDHPGEQALRDRLRKEASIITALSNLAQADALTRIADALEGKGARRGPAA